MKRRMLDTDILSMFFRGDADVVQKADEYLAHFDCLTICIITYYEILRGLEFKNATTKLAQFEAFVNDNQVLDLDLAACKIAAQLYAVLRREGKLIADADLLIAAIALANDCMLVTNNVRHFARVPSLQIENWKIATADETTIGAKDIDCKTRVIKGNTNV